MSNFRNLFVRQINCDHLWSNKNSSFYTSFFPFKLQKINKFAFFRKQITFKTEWESARKIDSKWMYPWPKTVCLTESQLFFENTSYFFRMLSDLESTHGFKKRSSPIQSFILSSHSMRSQTPSWQTRSRGCDAAFRLPSSGNTATWSWTRRLRGSKSPKSPHTIVIWIWIVLCLFFLFVFIFIFIFHECLISHTSIFAF